MIDMPQIQTGSGRPFQGLGALGSDAGFRPAAVTLRFIPVVRFADSGCPGTRAET